MVGNFRKPRPTNHAEVVASSARVLKAIDSRVGLFAVSSGLSLELF
jgi:hypothetical protein